MPITLGEAVTCRDLHDLDGEGRYEEAESGAETLTHSAARGKESRGQGTAGDDDEWRSMQKGLR